MKKLFFYILIIFSLFIFSTTQNIYLQEPETRNETVEEEEEELEEAEEAEEEEETEEPEEAEEELEETEEPEEVEEEEETEEPEEEELDEEAEMESSYITTEIKKRVKTKIRSEVTDIYSKHIDSDKITGFLVNTIGVLSTGFATGLGFSTKNVRTVRQNLKKGIIVIPEFGILKFEKPEEETKKVASKKEETEEGEEEEESEELEEEESEEERVEAKPKLVGVLYDETGKNVKEINAGPLKLKKLTIFIISRITPPRIECDFTFFGKTGKLYQKTAEEGINEFILSFPERPFLFPVGIKRSAKISEFTLRLSPDEKYIYTKTRLFGTETEEPSLIKLDLGEGVPTFSVTSKNITFGTIFPFLKNTPLKKKIIKESKLMITIVPFSLKLQVKNVDLFGLGTLNKGQIRLGSAGA